MSRKHYDDEYGELAPKAQAPREFLLNEYMGKVSVEMKTQFGFIKRDEKVHVIEFTALDQLREELSNIKKCVPVLPEKLRAAEIRIAELEAQHKKDAEACLTAFDVTTELKAKNAELENKIKLALDHEVYLTNRITELETLTISLGNKTKTLRAVNAELKKKHTEFVLTAAEQLGKLEQENERLRAELRQHGTGSVMEIGDPTYADLESELKEHRELGIIVYGRKIEVLNKKIKDLESANRILSSKFDKAREQRNERCKITDAAGTFKMHKTIEQYDKEIEAIV